MLPLRHAAAPLPAPAPVPWLPLGPVPALPCPRAPVRPDGTRAQALEAPRPTPSAGKAPKARHRALALPLVVLALAITVAPAPPALSETLVATRTIRPATPIDPADVTLIPENHPGALSDPDAILGQEARVALYPGRPIRPGDIGPAAVVERNAIVALKFRRGGLTILAEGRALGRGAPGETVRVMNLASRSTVNGIIGPDGTVHVAGSARPSH